jgi:hypothetical protein
VLLDVEVLSMLTIEKLRCPPKAPLAEDREDSSEKAFVDGERERANIVNPVESFMGET